MSPVNKSRNGGFEVIPATASMGAVWAGSDAGGNVVDGGADEVGGRIEASSTFTVDVGGPAAEPTVAHAVAASTSAITDHGTAPDLTSRKR